MSTNFRKLGLNSSKKSSCSRDFQTFSKIYFESIKLSDNLSANFHLFLPISAFFLAPCPQENKIGYKTLHNFFLSISFFFFLVQRASVHKLFFNFYILFSFFHINIYICIYIPIYCTLIHGYIFSFATELPLQFGVLSVKATSERFPRCRI